MEKVFSEGPVSLSVVSADGVAKVKASISAELGGGKAQGVLKANGAIEIELAESQALQLGFALLNSHLPPALQGLAQALEDKLLALAAAPSAPSA